MPRSPADRPAETPSQDKIHYDLSDMKPWREYAVILFNDEEHSVPEVELQLVRALGCHLARARVLTARVHTNGSAVVALTHRERAFQIAVILRQINLRVGLRQTN